jgi:hypothetical protein
LDWSEGRTLKRKSLSCSQAFFFLLFLLLLESIDIRAAAAMNSYLEYFSATSFDYFYASDSCCPPQSRGRSKDRF